MRDGLQKMRFAKSNGGVDEQGIVRQRLVRRGRHDLLRGRVGELVRAPHMEGLEFHAAIERRAGKRIGVCAVAHRRLRFCGQGG